MKSGEGLMAKKQPDQGQLRSVTSPAAGTFGCLATQSDVHITI
jgi:hypothetical protein